MADPRTASGRRRLATHGLLLTALGGVLLSFNVVSGFAADKTIEAAGSIGAYKWEPSTATIGTNGTVEFKNSQTNGLHGVVFTSPPATPNCTGNVPSVGTDGPWSGTCTFTQAGTYQF